jgi:Glycosyltransferase sugar-binding region containing DXD motif
MFWHGRPLSRIERLSMTSFLRNGHPVELYAYDEPAGVPAGVRVRDASEILPRDALFMHKRRNSIAHFADWFRYELLFKRGGLWSDTDMVCLQPFDYPNPVVFAWQDDQYLNNAVLGLPAGDALAKWLASACEHPNRMLPYDDFDTRLRKVTRWLKGRGREYVRWGDTGPYGLTSAARHLGYLEHALPQWHFYPVTFENHRVLFESGTMTFNGSRAVHIWNQLLDAGAALDRDARFPADSPFEQLWTRYMGGGGA